jgi:hypothetical protein
MFFFATLIAIAYSDVPFGTNLGSNNNVIGYSNLNSDFVSNNDSYISVTLSTKRRTTNLYRNAMAMRRIRSKVADYKQKPDI